MTARERRGGAAGAPRADAPGASRVAWALGALALIVAALFAADLALGSVRIPASGVLDALLGRSADPAWTSIVRVFRLPKAITALAAGAALAVSGLILQTVFRNPLAGPDSLGIGAGASAGVAFVVLAMGSAGGSAFFEGIGVAGYAAIAAAAGAGALLVLLLILALSRRIESAVTVLIVGLLIGYLAGSLVSVLVYFGSPQKAKVYLGWTYGSFSSVTASQLPVLLGAVAAGIGLTARSSKPLNALLMGERFAEGLGVRVRSARARVLVAAAILAGAVTAFCGPIAFLGIAAPQAARRAFRSSDHAALIPGSALVGAAFALAADIASQAPGGGSVLPINPLLSIIGAPIVLSLFLRGGRGPRRDEGGLP
jgi:iron complex transport system permease protein